MRRLQSITRVLAEFVAFGLLLWAAGLGWFIHQGLTVSDDPAAATDAFVALTGGRLRVESGIDLLEAGKAQKLFVSGVNQHVDRDALLRAFGPLRGGAECCIVLGHDADNTYGNARETAVWMRREGYRSLRLVTSWYHMPRSRLEFARALPEAAILSHPVFAGLQAGDWWQSHIDLAWLVVREYDKYLAALSRPVLTPLRSLLPVEVLPERHATAGRSR